MTGGADKLAFVNLGIELLGLRKLITERPFGNFLTQLKRYGSTRTVP